MNEGALTAARHNRPCIEMRDLESSVIRLIAGLEKKSQVVTEQARRLTAYHEAGHAVVMKLLPTHDPVHQITIVPRGQAGGMTISLPQEDRAFRSKTELFEDIVALLGGRAAEALVLGDISTGAANDLDRATATARSMVARYGMSEALGNVVYDDHKGEVFIGRSMAAAKPYSEEVAALIDAEVKALMDRACQRATELLSAHRAQLEEVAQYLLAHETMGAEAFERVFEG
jgi:cell division protease FtsH